MELVCAHLYYYMPQKKITVLEKLVAIKEDIKKLQESNSDAVTAATLKELTTYAEIAEEKLTIEFEQMEAELRELEERRELLKKKL